MKKGNLVLILSIFGATVFLSSCVGGSTNPYPGSKPVEPIYMNYDRLEDVRNLEEQPVENTKTIVLQNDIFYMMENAKGIHVYDVKDSSNVKYITFIKIPAISSFIVKGDRLYADSWRDLVTIDITTVTDIRVVQRQRGVFLFEAIPPNHNGYFVCPDYDRGAIIGWRSTNQSDYQCRTF